MSEVSMLLPKSDVIFKLFFSDERNIDLLKGFLKFILDLPEDDYNEITVIDPHLPREHPADKLGILDVKLTSATAIGKILHLEMQVLPIPNMESRVVFYQAKMIVEHIPSSFYTLRPEKQSSVYRLNRNPCVGIKQAA